MNYRKKKSPLVCRHMGFKKVQTSLTKSDDKFSRNCKRCIFFFSNVLCLNCKRHFLHTFSENHCWSCLQTLGKKQHTPVHYNIKVGKKTTVNSFYIYVFFFCSSLKENVISDGPSTLHLASLLNPFTDCNKSYCNIKVKSFVQLNSRNKTG